MSIVKNPHLIDLVDLNKSYSESFALKNMNLYIRKNEFVTLLGPSGCGKTTTLRLIGGFETPTSGKILFDGVDITDMPPYMRRVNTVFQRYALFPHLSVFENIAFGLRLRKVPKDEIEKKVNRMLDLVNLTGRGNRNINTLSGGQQQRIAIARALVNEPEVLLLDEPLGALDLKLRKEMQIELKNIQQNLGITFLYVTHDQEEALTMSDTIVVMRDGLIQQIGQPIDIYNEPKNAFVADFIGESNIFDAIMIRDEVVRFENTIFPCVDKGFGENNPVDVVLRPEDIKVHQKPEEGQVQGVVRSVVFKGVHYEMMIQSETNMWKVHSTIPQVIGAQVGMSVIPFDIHIMRKEVGA